jgi:glyoxylase-like metal-dependent hydrolase (beta-lactamase superfamily II)
MLEILNNIYVWHWFSKDKGYDFNGYLICHESGNLCIDPVEPDTETLDEIAKLGVAQILLTNRNHSRAANLVRERTGARTTIHPDDSAHAKSEGTVVDDTFQVGQTIGPLEVVTAQGKSPGEVAFCWPERRLLIVGDIVIGNPPGACCLLSEAVMDDAQLLKQSVRALLVLDVDTLLVGDGVSILEGAQAKLHALVATFAD